MSPARPAAIGAAAAAAVMALAQVAIPLTTRRAGLSSVVVVALAACALALAGEAWGWARALGALVAVAPAALAVEVVGTRTGWPFGAYHYTSVLRPTLAGVPIIVPLAWFGMGVAAWELAGRIGARWWQRVALGALALTGWDLFLDPQMTREHYWLWDRGGFYRGIPLTNYAGWLLCSAAVMALLSRPLPGRGRSTPLLALFTWMAVMETVGFVVFFGDPVVGVVGGAVTIPLAVWAWRRGSPVAPTTMASTGPVTAP